MRLPSARWRFLGCQIVVLTLAIFALRGRAIADEGRRPPNILLILADDLGFSDLGCYGGEIQTPNLDALAETGLRFSQFYNTGRCWPTRGSLLSGYYAQQIRRDYLPGVPSGNVGRRPDWAVLLPEMLAEAGYRSYHIGKWHIDGQPVASGFDRSSVDQVRRYFKPKIDESGKPVEPLEFEDEWYLTSAMADGAIADLRHHAEHFSDRPFFQYLAFTAPHFPLHALPEDIAKYAHTYDEGWDVIRRQRWQRMRSIGILDLNANKHPSSVERDLGPPYHFPDAFEILGEGETNRPLPWNQLSETRKRFQATKMAIHAAMVHRMDIAIGRVLDQIRTMGQFDDTLILFLSDNGASAEIMVRGDGHDPDADPGSATTYLCLGPGWSTTSNTPFRRHKTWTHEGGIATPFIASWTNGIKDRGAIRRQPQHVIDVAATVLELTGTRHPSDAPQPPGQSFIDSLRAGPDDGPPAATDRTLWWYHDGNRAIRKGNWKAVSSLEESWELYDLQQDRIESTDLAISHREVLDDLVGDWEAQLQASIELTKQGLKQSVLDREANRNHRSGKMWEAQQAGLIPRQQVLPNAETFRIKDRHAFVMLPQEPASAAEGKPWIFYAPALSRYPDQHERWMHERFLAAGVAVAGIDVGEAYGSPHSVPFFDALYDRMVADGYSRKPALLGRSRGGLWVSRFAIDHPDRVAGIGGIYPVFDYTTYPGPPRAASAYGIAAEDLSARQSELNPVRQIARLAEHAIPVYLIHGADDKVVPFEQNSGAVAAAYDSSGAGDSITVEKIQGQGHNFWPGFFRCEGLIEFLIDSAKGDH